MSLSYISTIAPISYKEKKQSWLTSLFEGVLHPRRPLIETEEPLFSWKGESQFDSPFLEPRAEQPLTTGWRDCDRWKPSIRASVAIRWIGNQSFLRGGDGRRELRGCVGVVLSRSCKPKAMGKKKKKKREIRKGRIMTRRIVEQRPLRTSAT